MSVKQLFDMAAHGITKEQRRAAFQQLRYLSQYGQPEEAGEAKLALQHSGLYQSLGGNMAEITKIISKLSLAPGITQKTADEETAKLKNIFSEIGEKLEETSS